MRQDYHLYTQEDHKVWSILFDRQMRHLPEIATASYLNGIKKCGFVPDRVPNFDRVNQALKSATGWMIYVVPGLIDNQPFFNHLSQKQFPATNWLRKMSELEYLEEPDMFHDIFGHIPLLSDPFFSDFLAGISDITLQHINNEHIVELMARLYWYTIEFGLITEDHQIKIYGAGILSSAGESLYAVSDSAAHLPYDPATIMNTPYIKDKFQAQYFVIDSYEQLFDSLAVVRELIDIEAGKMAIRA